MKKQRFNKDWLFYKSGQEEMKQTVTLPHDAMIYEKGDPKSDNGGASGFFPGGKYIYEKEIYGDSSFQDKTVLLEFEGVYMNSTVYLNGEEAGGWYYGYTNFFVDLTDKLLIGKKNQLKVVADNSITPNSRWYSGSGIYRPVNLWTSEKTHILPQGVKVKTLSIAPAMIEITVETSNADNAEFCYTILKEGKEMKAVTAGTPQIHMEVPDADLWSAENPSLYQLKVELLSNKKVVDTAETLFGIRSLEWNAVKGFLVNGKEVKLRGGCVHHDHGILGAAAYDKAELRRIKMLKNFGFNAIRYSHNPAGKNFLDICDELGMYVIDESFDQWKVPQSKYDYANKFEQEWKKDVKALIDKDYNHPCVIMYGIGNEITDLGLPGGEKTARVLGETFHKLDSTRPTMLANNHMLTVLGNMKAKKRAEAEAEASKRGESLDEEALGSAQVNEIVTQLPKIMAETKPDMIEAIAGKSFHSVDIVGYNYGSILYKGTHEAEPERVILSSETFPGKMYENWEVVKNNNFVIGDFQWTAWDYLGEAGVGLPVYGTTQAPFSKDYPCLTAACGSIDITGFPETAAYYNMLIWGTGDTPYLAVRPVNHSGEEFTIGNWRLTDSIPCWTWEGEEDKKAQIEFYGTGNEVELFWNDMSQGKKKIENLKAQFEIPYQPGTLRAVSYDEKGASIETVELRTANEQCQLQLLPEEKSIKADGEDIVFVPIHVIDEEGILQMTRDKKIKIAVEGPGRLLAFGSGRPETEENFHDAVHTSWHGRALAVIQSLMKEGNIIIKAEAEDCEEVQTVIKALRE